MRFVIHSESLQLATVVDELRYASHATRLGGSVGVNPFCEAQASCHCMPRRAPHWCRWA